jgi:hypothetical protein
MGEPEETPSNDQEYHPSDAMRQLDPLYQMRMELEKLSPTELANRFLALHQQHQTVLESKSLSERRRVTDESQGPKTQNQVLRPVAGLPLAGNSRLEYEKSVDERALAHEARGRIAAIDHAQAATAKADFLQQQLGTGEHAYRDFSMGMQKAVTEAVATFTEKTTGVALAAMQQIAKEGSAMHKAPYRVFPRTLAEQNTDLHAAFDKATRQPAAKSPATTAAAAMLPAATRRQAPAKTPSVSSSDDGMDQTETQPPALVVTIGTGTDIKKASWASILRSSKDKAIKALMIKPRFNPVLSSQRVELPRVLCGPPTEESDTKYFRSLLEEGLDETQVPNVAAVLMEDYYTCVEKQHQTFNHTRRPSAVEVLARANGMPLDGGSDASDSEGSDGALEEPETHYATPWNSPTARKGTAQMATDLAKVRISNTATTQQFLLWKTTIGRAGRAAFGANWQTSEEALVRAANTFQDELNEDWLAKAAQAEQKHKPTPESEGWTYMTNWLEEQITHEVRDLELEAKQLLLSGRITQGSKTVTQYIATLKRAARNIPTVEDMDMIVWFLHGLSDSLKHKCLCDQRGRTWRNFDELRDHALSKEMELNSIRQARTLNPERNAFARKRSDHDRRDKSVTFGRPNLAVMEQGEYKPSPTSKRHRGQTNSPNRGGEGSRGRSAQPRQSQAKVPRFTGPSDDDCPAHRHVTNAQANWLYAKGLCACCGERMSVHETEVAGVFTPCKYKAKPKNLTAMHAEMPPSRSARKY